MIGRDDLAVLSIEDGFAVAPDMAVYRRVRWERADE
jgi:hypothetical protein